MAKFAHESTILAARDPSLDSNTDEWPEFDLSNVSVHLPNDDGSVANLLLATEYYPLTVRGQLLLTDEHADLFLQPTGKKRVNVEITDVKTFSYGQYTNGAVALWAAGKSGWYSINPSRAYKSAFLEMSDAVNIFYFIVDAYRDPRKTGKSKNATILPPYSAQEIFEKYAAEVMDDPAEHAEAAEKFYHHRDFILSSMVAGKEGILWGHNPIFLHLSRRYAPDYTRIKRRVMGPRTRSADSRSNHESAETSSNVGALKRKRGRQAGGNSKSPEVIELDSTPEPDIGASVDVEREEDREESQPSRHRPTRSNKGRRTRQNTSVETQAEVGATPVQGDLSDDEGGEKVPAHRKRKSLLRLKPSKASKSVTRAGKALMQEELPDDNVTTSPSPDTSAAEMHGRSQRHPKRRAAGGHEDEDEGIDMADSHSEDDPAVLPTSSELASRQEFEALPLRTLNHQPDPVQEDTWVCALDGCSHKVYSASATESQQLIREHYALHAYDDDERVQLVKRLQAPSLPVRHLMEKVRQQAKVEGFPGSRVAGTRYPEALPATAVSQKY